MKLGADVINMSIGSDSGFTYDSELEGELGNIYEKLEKAGIVVCIFTPAAKAAIVTAPKLFTRPCTVRIPRFITDCCAQVSREYAATSR